MPTLPEAECRRRLGEARHLVLATVHPARGVDVVPVVAAAEGATVWIPVDTVKAKSTTSLRRVANVRRDPRVSLLAEHYDDDWSRLWWVRAHGTAREAGPEGLARARTALRRRYRDYEDPTAIVAALLVEVDRWSGWSAQPF